VYFFILIFAVFLAGHDSDKKLNLFFLGYPFGWIDRINLTNARMFAFENSLHATNEQFSWAIAVFYCGYGLAEIPSMIALLYLSPKVWLPASMFVW